MMAKNGQAFVLEIAEMPRLMVDPLRFRQVVFNYVSNAVKYAGPCTIRISSTYEDGLFKLTVADNGRGVSPEKAKHLMQPFVQADIKNRAEGSGLGLAICKRLVELAHGTISIDTAPGKGFAIHVEVPVDVAPEGQASGKDGTTRALAISNLPKRIRADERLAHLKVCSITADVEARMTYRDQGFDMLLLKPVTIEKMADLFNGL